MRRKCIAVSLLVCVLAALLLGGCGSEKGSAVVIDGAVIQQQEDITYLSMYGFKADTLNLTAIEEAMHGYMEKREDVIVTYEGVKGTAYWNAFTLRVSTNNLDDIFMIDHDRMIQLSAEGKLADLSGLATISSFNDMARQQFTESDGSVYFLPTCISAYGIYMNYDLLEAHGQKIPENRQEFYEVCDYFVSQGMCPITANNYASLRTLVVAVGLYDIYQMEDPTEKIESFNQESGGLAEQLLPGFELVKDMIDRGYLEAEHVLKNEQSKGELAEFATGEYPFMLAGAWVSPRLMALGPEFEYGVYPYPVLEDGNVLVMDCNTCVSVNAACEDLEAALSVVEYLTEKDVIWEYCDSQVSYTPMMDDRTPSDKTIAPSAEYLINGRNVIGTDFKLTIPMDSAILSAANLLFEGAGAEEASACFARLVWHGGEEAQQ